jgi:hypothetical protein
MNTPSTTVDADLTVDTVAVCECCTLKGIKVDDFLEAFAENLPALGVRVLLRIHEPKRTAVGLLLRRCGNEH